MAKIKTPPIKDLTLYESTISFFPPEFKNNLWAAQNLYFQKQNSTQLLDVTRSETYNKLDRLIINTQAYIDMIDPPTPQGVGGKAEYFAADFQTIPIDIHLDNIARAKLDKLSDVYKLQVNQIDKFAKSQKQREKDKILYQREFRSIINELQEIIDIPPIKEGQDPYAYAKMLVNEKGELKQGKDGNENEGSDAIDTMLDYIKSQINDSQDMSLYMSNVYKGDVEKSFELGIQHLLINMNKWSVQCIRFNRDIKNFNLCCGRWYTDEISGRGTVEYINPTILYTNPFAALNGEDITRWNYEKDISFAEFVRQFGQKLTDKELKEVFELNKNNGGSHGLSWGQAKGARGANANIRIGYMACLTQDVENFSETLINGVPLWDQKPLSWLPEKGEREKLKQTMYNVWYSFYYIPPPGNKLSSNSQTDWAWQSKYIFNLKKDVDMYRHGTDLRYAKSTLVIWKDLRPSFTDIKEAFMPKIRTEWHKFQNCIINDFGGTFLNQDLISAVLNAAEESNKVEMGQRGSPTGGTGLDAVAVAMRQLKQSGLGIASLRDRNGNMILDPEKVFMKVDNGLLNKAEIHLKLILDQYNLMMMALAQNDVTEGQLSKPRTTNDAVNAAIASAAQGNWFMLKGAIEFLVMYGERCVQHILCIVKEKKEYGFKERWKEFQNVIGMGNALMIESIEDLNPEEIGMTVSLEDVSAKQQLYTQLTLQMSHDGAIGEEDVEMIISTLEQNWKYGATLLSLAAKRKAKEKANQEMMQHKMAMESKEKDLQIAQALTAAKGQAKDQNIITEGKVKGMIDAEMAKLKEGTQLKLKDKISDNRQKEATHKKKLEEGVIEEPAPQQ